MYAVVSGIQGDDGQSEQVYVANTSMGAGASRMPSAMHPSNGHGGRGQRGAQPHANYRGSNVRGPPSAQFQRPAFVPTAASGGYRQPRSPSPTPEYLQVVSDNPKDCILCAVRGADHTSNKCPDLSVWAPYIASARRLARISCGWACCPAQPLPHPCPLRS